MNVVYFFILGLYFLPVTAYSFVTISQEPVSISVKPNIIIGYDDSGSMSRTFIPDSPSPVLTAESSKSHYYNPIYFDPNFTYIPWVKAKTSVGLIRYNNAPINSVISFSADNSSPVTKGSSLSLNATYKVTYVCGRTTYSSTVDYETGAPFLNRISCQNKNGMTYTINSAYIVQNGQSWQKGVLAAPIYYNLVPSTTTCGLNAPCVNAPVCLPNSTCPKTNVGDKLQKVTISLDDTSALQNYANWQMYASTRAKLVSYAMSEVLPSLSGVLIGFHPFNSTSTSNNTVRAIDSAIVPTTYGSSYYSTSGRMYNIDVFNDVNILLDLIYNTVSSSATPTHATLNNIGLTYSNKNLSFSTHDDEGNLVGGAGIIQYGCQKNYAFVLTDGYANENTLPIPPVYDASIWGRLRPFITTWPASLADIALSYYSNNLRNDLPEGQVLVDFSVTKNPDNNKNLHLNTYSLTLGSFGNIYSSFTLDPFSVPPVWINPTTATNNADQIDDLWHATINGRGQMLNADDPKTLVQEIIKIFKGVALGSGGKASIGLASRTTNNTNNYLYKPSFNSFNWSGDLKKYEIDLLTGQVSNAAIWSAQEQLSTYWSFDSNTSLGRNIVTFDQVNGKGIELKYIKSLDIDLIKYVYGYRQDDGVVYKGREALLGDIINATPLVIQDNNVTTVYQASNDGMLHAFSSITGKELWAYVPSQVLNQFQGRASKTGVHEYIVDGSPVAGRVGDKIILVGGLGNNDKSSSFYALDITNSRSNYIDDSVNINDAINKVLWEFPYNQTQKSNLGLSTSRPLIINTRRFGTVVMISSGYNNGSGVGESGGDGNGHLWFLDPITGNVLTELVTSTVPVTPSLGMSSLSAFSVVITKDSLVDFIYGGDLQGNLWRFDISDADFSKWTSTKIALLFDSLGVSQPVTTAPDLSIDDKDHKPLIYIGTGQLFNKKDISNNTIQSFYAIKDFGSDVTMSRLSKLQYGNRLDWLNKEVIVDSITTNRTIVDPTVPFIGSAPVPFDWQKSSGWYFDFPQSGERVLGTIQISKGRLVFASAILADRSCNNSSYVYVLDLKGNSGFFMDEPSTKFATKHKTSILLNPPILYDTPTATYLTTPNQDGSFETSKIAITLRGSRLATWKEIIRE